MTFLDESDAVHLRAAQESLRRTDPAEAAVALSKIRAELQCLPPVLEVRWEICAQQGDWVQALRVAEQLRGLVPDQPYAWLCQACSLAELNRPQEALETLTAAHAHLPTDPGIVYNLACFTCKAGQREQAIAWLNLAMRFGGRAETKLMAMDDPDLQPLMDYVCSL